jgi:hypothetical protein
MPRGQPGTPVRPTETQLLSDYLAARHSTDRIQLQPRLGEVRPELQDANLTANELRALGVFRRYPDAVIFKPDRVIIIEASVKPDVGKISILDLYAHLFRLTPEFAEFKEYPITKRCVWGMEDQAAGLIARQHGCEVHIFTPDWLAEYLDTLRPRDRRAPRVGLS